MTRHATPLERLLARYWDHDRERLLPLLEQRFGVRIEPQQLNSARDVSTFAASLKDQVDHPGRLERVAERLLQS
jgi:hypothetical protein